MNIAFHTFDMSFLVNIMWWSFVVIVQAFSAAIVQICSWEINEWETSISVKCSCKPVGGGFTLYIFFCTTARRARRMSLTELRYVLRWMKANGLQLQVSLNSFLSWSLQLIKSVMVELLEGLPGRKNKLRHSAVSVWPSLYFPTLSSRGVAEKDWHKGGLCSG